MSYSQVLNSVIAVFCLSLSRQSLAMPLEDQGARWTIEGVVEEVVSLEGPPFRVRTGDTYRIDFAFEIESSTAGNIQWQGRFTEFSLNLAGTDFTADLDAVPFNAVVFQPGDTPSEEDFMGLWLGGASGLIPLSYAGGMLGADFRYISTGSTSFLDDDPKPWTRSPNFSGGSSGSPSLVISAYPTQPNNPFNLARLGLGVGSIGVIPEPSVLCLTLVGLLSLTVARRRRSSATPI